MSSTATIRAATRLELASLVGIYNHYATNTHITFDTATFTVDQRRTWFDGFAESGPYRLLVAVMSSRVVGYTSSARFRPKPAYDRSVETAIYLDPGFTGRGIGTQLYGELLRVLESDPGVHRAYGAIALPNPGSVALHERLGFRLVGTLREVGFKFGRFLDVSWYERDVSGSDTVRGGDDSGREELDRR